MDLRSAFAVSAIFSFVLFMTPVAFAQESEDAVTGDFIRTYPVIRPGAPKTITENVLAPAGTPIHELNIDVVNTVVQGRIDVRPTTAEEAGFEVLPGGVVFGYINVTTKNMGSQDLREMLVKFRVNKTWVEENGVIPESVTMLRLDPGAWVDLGANLTANDSVYYFYETRSTTFSFFAVVGEREAAVQQPSEETPAEEPEVIGAPEVVEVEPGEDIFERRARENLATGIIVGIAVVVVAALFLVPGSFVRKSLRRK